MNIHICICCVSHMLTYLCYSIHTLSVIFLSTEKVQELEVKLLKAKQDNGQLSKEARDSKHKSEMLSRLYEECKTRIDELLMEQLRNNQEVTRLKNQLDAVNAENVSLCVCVCVCVCVRACVSVCVWVGGCVPMCVYAYLRTCTLVCMYACVSPGFQLYAYDICL